MDGTEVKFPTCVSGFRVCRRVVRFMAPATTRAAETFLPYLVLNEFHKDYISEIHIQANYAVKDEKDFVKLRRHAVKDLNVCQFGDMIS